MTSREERFRRTAARLDELLRRDELQIVAQGVVIIDECARTYHYKNDLLSWRYRFEIRRPRGSEVEKVWTVASLDESSLDTLRFWTRSEIFRIGQSSRWEHTTEFLRPIEEVVREGLAAAVLGAIGAGQVAAADVS